MLEDSSIDAWRINAWRILARLGNHGLDDCRKAWTEGVTQGIYNYAYDSIYTVALNAGAPEDLASSIADTEANNFIASPEACN